jgi:hypothetical protein
VGFWVGGGGDGYLVSTYAVEGRGS